jgi:hypothetical protein
MLELTGVRALGGDEESTQRFSSSSATTWMSLGNSGRTTSCRSKMIQSTTGVSSWAWGPFPVPLTKPPADGFRDNDCLKACQPLQGLPVRACLAAHQDQRGWPGPLFRSPSRRARLGLPGLSHDPQHMASRRGRGEKKKGPRRRSAAGLDCGWPAYFPREIEEPKLAPSLSPVSVMSSSSAPSSKRASSPLKT